MCAMTPQNRAAAQKRLHEINEALKGFKAVTGNAYQEKKSRLFRQAIDLRRKLAEDAIAPPDCRPAAASRAECTEAAAVEPAPAVNQPAQPAAPQSWLRRQWQARGRQFNDCALHPIVRLVICGACLLAWTIKPGATDPPLAISLLMFLRFVPIFIVGGSFFERAAAGMLIGSGLFFALLGAESLSLAMWDAHLAIPVASFKVVWHAEYLANVLYLLGVVGLLLCAVVTHALRREQQYAYQRYLRLSVQALVMVQLALVAELGYTGLRHAIGTDQNSAGIVETLKSLHAKSSGQG